MKMQETQEFRHQQRSMVINLATQLLNFLQSTSDNVLSPQNTRIPKCCADERESGREEEPGQPQFTWQLHHPQTLHNDDQGQRLSHRAINILYVG